jgi:hypothetical protein
MRKLLIAAGVTLALAPAAHAQSAICAGHANCQVVTSPWVSVPQPTSTNKGLFPGVAYYTLDCTRESDVVHASDYLMASGINAFVQLPGTVNEWIGPQPDASFAMLNGSLKASTKLYIACAPLPGAAARAAQREGNGVRKLVRSRRLRPGRTLRARLSCGRGERLRDGGAAIAWHRGRRPTRAELRHEIRVTRSARAVRARVDAGRGVGDDERVELQLTAHCRLRR